jgi:hypothetical protein
MEFVSMRRICYRGSCERRAASETIRHSVEPQRSCLRRIDSALPVALFLAYLATCCSTVNVHVQSRRKRETAVLAPGIIFGPGVTRILCCVLVSSAGLVRRRVMIGAIRGRSPILSTLRKHGTGCWPTNRSAT